MGYAFTFSLIVLDFLTGMGKAFATNTFSSKVMRQGLFHKVALVLVMLHGWLMDYAQAYIDLGTKIPVGAACCVYIFLMELCSSLENLCQMNPDLMPDKLCEIFGGLNLSEKKEPKDEDE